jgi:hypothetical protein
MPEKSAVVLRVLLNHFHKTPSDALLRFLPSQEAAAVRNVDITNTDVLPVLSGPFEQIKAVHYSWLIPAVKNIIPSLQSLIMTILPEPQKTKIGKALSIPLKTASPLPKAVQYVLLKNIATQVKSQDVLPLAYLPNTILSPLSTLNKNQLVMLIGYLGIHDLAESIRHIINKKFLAKLYNVLSSKQKHCLRICLHKPEKVVSTKMEIEKWDGDPKKLDSMLQRRGLVRLGKALCGQHPDLVWYIAHTLDSGRGSILLQNFSPEATKGVTALLVQQVVNMIDFHNTKESGSRDK